MLGPSLRMKKKYPPGVTYGDEFPWRNRTVDGCNWIARVGRAYIC